jgi:hypothetical protein
MRLLYWLIEFRAIERRHVEIGGHLLSTYALCVCFILLVYGYVCKGIRSCKQIENGHW